MDTHAKLRIKILPYAIVIAIDRVIAIAIANEVRNSMEVSIQSAEWHVCVEVRLNVVYGHCHWSFSCLASGLNRCLV